MKSLKKTIYLQIMLLMIIVNVITAFVTFITSAQDINKQLTAEAHQISKRTARSLALPFWNLDSVGVNEIIGAQIQNANMKAIFISEESKVKQFALGVKKQTNGNVLELTTLSGMKDQHSYTSPILFENEQLGTVTVSLTNTLMRSLLIKNLLYSTLGQIFIIILLALPLSYMIANSFSKPINKLGQTFEQVIENHFESPVPPAKTVEINTISAIFENVRRTLLKTFETIRENEKLLSITLDSITDGIISVDKSGEIIRLNPIAEEITGWPSVTAKGKLIDQLLKELQGLSSEDILNIKNSSSEEPLQREISTEHHKTARTINVVSSHILDEHNQKRGVVIVLRNLTSQIKVEEELKQKRKMEALGQLAGGVAHDFNNMLGGIIGFTELIQESLEIDSEERQYTNYVLEAAASAADLTAKLLAFSRKGKIVSTPFMIHKTCETAISLLSRTLNKNISITQDLAAEEQHISGDPSQIQNAILNLCINAKDAMPNGGSLHIVSSNCNFTTSNEYNLEPGGYIKLDIIDTGSGIPLEIQQNIFEPFFTTKETGKGTGLGLAAVYGSIKNHHGSVIVSSIEEQGTTFTIFLPTVQAPLMNSELLVKKSDIQKTDKHILVVDDEKIIRFMIERIVTDMGGTVSQAADGAEAIEIFQEKHNEIDLVILDMVMPNVSGDQCFYELQKIDSSVPILLASGYDKNSAISTLLEDGALSYLHKPFRINEVTDIIKSLS